VLSATSPSLSYKFLGNTGTHKPVNLFTIFSTSESNCPIAGFFILQTFNGINRQFQGNQVTVDANNMLTFTTGTPMNTNLLIQAYSKAPKFALKSIKVRVCGDEVVSLSSTGAKAYAFWYPYAPTNIYPVVAITDLHGLFSVLDADCTFNKVELTHYDSPSFSPYTDNQLSISTRAGGFKDLNIKSDKLMSTTTFALKGESVSPGNYLIKDFEVTVCQPPQYKYIGNSASSSVPHFKLQKDTGM
jgi:hypothetical protein